MKTLKIFLASSNELQPEREMMASLANSLNTVLERQGVNVIVVQWENLDASMGENHKQEDYNEKLRECDMCMVLYWTKFGMYTKIELETAFNELKAGNNPKKVYVYFKEDDTEVTDELKEFRDSFPTKYGHFYTPFSNFDTLKAHFLLQFMDYQSQVYPGNKFIEVKNGKVTIDDKEYVELKEIPFAGNNEEYQLLQRNIKKTQKLLSITEPDDPDYEDYSNELQELQEKLSKMESSLWNTALLITRLSTTKCSERLQRAMDLFSIGDNKGAEAILKEEEIEKDVEHNLNLIKLGDEGRNGLKINIEEYQLKIKTLESSYDDGWYETVDRLYQRCIELASGVIDKGELVILLSDYADFLSDIDRDEDSINVYLQSQAVFHELTGEDSDRYSLAAIWNLKSLCGLYCNDKHYVKAEDALKEAMQYSSSEYDACEKAELLCYLGYVYMVSLKYNEAEKVFHEAISTISDNTNVDGQHVLNHCYCYLGEIYKRTNRVILAEKYLEKALKICTDLGLPEDSLIIADTCNRLGNVYTLRGKLEDAKKVYQRCLDTYSSLSLKNPFRFRINIICALGNLASVYLYQGEHKKSEEYLNEAYGIVDSLFKQHPDEYLEYHLQVSSDLAQVHRSVKHYDQAIYVLKRSIDKVQSSIRDDVPIFKLQLSHCYNLLGVTYYDNQNNKEARKALCESLKIREEICNVYGERHRNLIIQTLNNIGNVDICEHNFRDAEDVFNRILVENRKLEDGFEKKKILAQAYHNLSWLFIRNKQYERAVTEGLKSIDAYNKFDLSEIPNPNAILSEKKSELLNLCEAYYRLKDKNNAILKASEALEICEKLAEADPDAYTIHLVGCYTKLACLEYNFGDYQQALIDSQKAVSTYGSQEDIATRLFMTDTLACIHRELMMYDCSEKEFLECITICHELIQKNKPFHTGKLAHEQIELAKLYQSTGRVDESKVLIKEAEENLSSLDENFRLDFSDDVDELNRLINETN